MSSPAKLKASILAASFSALRLKFGFLLGPALLALGCVVSTFERPGEAPRLPSPPAPAAPPKPLASPEARKDEPRQIRASHILVTYRGAERSSPLITRNKDEARERASEALARARTGESFATLVSEYSDEPGASDRGGDLGLFEREQVVPEFGNAAFMLKVGELSQVVESPFGFHVILRTE